MQLSIAAPIKSGPMLLRVAEVTREASEVISLVLVGEDGRRLEHWRPGAHLDIALPSGRIRQYSLCSDPADLSHYRIAVRREAGGRGGSMELHDLARAGAHLRVRGLRNHFHFGDSEKYLFLAGGIGITPILPMILDAERRGRPWVLIYAGRNLAAMPFREMVTGRAGGHARLVPSDTRGRMDFEPVVSTLEPKTMIYACGPPGMLDAIQQVAAQNGRSGQVRIERFAPSLAAPSEPQPAFEVELRRSGRTLRVPENGSLAEALKGAGIAVPFSCEEGCCGSCETAVLAGTPRHCDSLLTEDERRTNTRMMVCVSGSRSVKLVLDL